MQARGALAIMPVLTACAKNADTFKFTTQQAANVQEKLIKNGVVNIALHCGNLSVIIERWIATD